ncbi:phosphopantetheine binding protein [Chitinophaga polysaccharea]|uniref:Phosphopantetheine binding protein n=1 Tax=Chitinophaga polysaccharea TaxID=1293035 RepID=A0A561PWP1_9BACT|nr:phosphopantetheine-binding protein [Chitinophaga polysaccharea]TWF42522.1 phosphopantetheine binding protein [Chitinophaga polysaccharea]
MEVKDKIRAFIVKNMSVWDDDIVLADTDNIFEKGFVNSLFAMQLLNFAEQEFNITIDNSEIDIANFSSVSNMEQLVTRKLLLLHAR